MKTRLISMAALIGLTASAGALAQNSPPSSIVMMPLKGWRHQSDDATWPDRKAGWMRLIDARSYRLSLLMSQDPSAPALDTTSLVLDLSGASLALMPDTSGNMLELHVKEKPVAKLKLDDVGSEPSLSKLAVAISTALGYQAVVTRVDGKQLEIQGFQEALSVGRQGLVLGDTAGSDWLNAKDFAPIAAIDIKYVEGTKAKVALTPLQAQKAVRVGDKILLPFAN